MIIVLRFGMRAQCQPEVWIIGLRSENPGCCVLGWASAPVLPGLGVSGCAASCLPLLSFRAQPGTPSSWESQLAAAEAGQAQPAWEEADVGQSPSVCTQMLAIINKAS